MSVVTDAIELLYFGKLPSRGDFVRSPGRAQLVDGLDRWQTLTLERLSTDPRWKLLYDEAPSIHFAILGTGSKVGLAGYWQPSQDASGRRFPFITAGSFDLQMPQQSAVLAPLALNKLWARLEQGGRQALLSTDFNEVAASLQGPLQMELPFEAARARLFDFMDDHTVASLEQMLAASGARVQVRQAVLALGLLLRPALAQGGARLTRMLCLPLPSEPGLRACAASWWLLLALGFLTRHEVELGLFMPARSGPPQLLLGFQGASASSLETVIDPQAPGREPVSLTALDWVEDEVLSDHGLRKLSTYLQDPGLSLAQAARTFQEVFLGS